MLSNRSEKLNSSKLSIPKNPAPTTEPNMSRLDSARKQYDNFVAGIDGKEITITSAYKRVDISAIEPEPK